MARVKNNSQASLKSFKRIFEEFILPPQPFEMLEYHYDQQAFGSGYGVYKCNGKNLLLIYDGKEALCTIKISPAQFQYAGISSTQNWETIFEKSAQENISEADKDKILRKIMLS